MYAVSAGVMRVFSATSAAPGERHRVVRRQHHVRVAGEQRDAVAGRDAQRLQRPGELQRALQELGIGEADVAVDDTDAVRIDARRAPQKRGRRQRLEIEAGRNRRPHRLRGGLHRYPQAIELWHTCRQARCDPGKADRSRRAVALWQDCDSIMDSFGYSARQAAAMSKQFGIFCRRHGAVPRGCARFRTHHFVQIARSC